MKISKLASALAFCLALSAGQAHAETVTVTLINYTTDNLNNIMFYPSDKSKTEDTKNSGNVKAGQSGKLTFDKPTGVCVFNFDATKGDGGPVGLRNWDYCKSNKTIYFGTSNTTNPTNPYNEQNLG